MKTIIVITVSTLLCMNLFAQGGNSLKLNEKTKQNRHKSPNSQRYPFPELQEKNSIKLDEEIGSVVFFFLEEYWKKYEDHEVWKDEEMIMTAYSIDEKIAMTRFPSLIPSELQPLPSGKYLEVIIEKKREKPVLGGGTFHILIDVKSSKVLCFYRTR